jgi:prepilin-type N-terminal cleavage/methylation domain-containing protein
MKNKKAFTLIEVMVVIAIIAILATVTLLLLSMTTSNSNLASARTSLKSALLAVASCKTVNGTVRTPLNTETGANSICLAGAGLGGANWPVLPTGYTYNAPSPAPVSLYDSISCSFSVYTNGDVTPAGRTYLTCGCASQKCE